MSVVFSTAKFPATCTDCSTKLSAGDAIGYDNARREKNHGAIVCQRCGKQIDAGESHPAPTHTVTASDQRNSVVPDILSQLSTLQQDVDDLKTLLFKTGFNQLSKTFYLTADGSVVERKRIRAYDWTLCSDKPPLKPVQPPETENAIEPPPF